MREERGREIKAASANRGLRLRQDRGVSPPLVRPSAEILTTQQRRISVIALSASAPRKLLIDIPRRCCSPIASVPQTCRPISSAS